MLKYLLCVSSFSLSLICLVLDCEAEAHFPELASNSDEDILLEAYRDSKLVYQLLDQDELRTYLNRANERQNEVYRRFSQGEIKDSEFGIHATLNGLLLSNLRDHLDAIASGIAVNSESQSVICSLITEVKEKSLNSLLEVLNYQQNLLNQIQYASQSVVYDSDADGLSDCDDACPSNFRKTSPGSCGCEVEDIDSDADGIADCNDNCQQDPGKSEEGLCGCGISDLDSDADGTPDCIDSCASDSSKIEPGICGCGVPDSDSDYDGTPDCNDSCEFDYTKVNAGICGCGVSDADSDVDGTPDCIDNCPFTSSKIEAGICGCNSFDFDTDGDGVMDCYDACPYNSERSVFDGNDCDDSLVSLEPVSDNDYYDDTLPEDSSNEENEDLNTEFVQEDELPEEEPDCGCKSMEIHSQEASSKVYCFRTYNDFEALKKRGDLPACEAIDKTSKENTCGSRLWQPVVCKTGPVSPAGPITSNGIGWAFEVRATLVDESKREMCKTGQFWKSTRKSFYQSDDGLMIEEQIGDPNIAKAQPIIPNGGPISYELERGVGITVVGDPNQVPAFDSDTFGADGYADENQGFMQSDDKQISWFDIPQMFFPGDYGLPGDLVAMTMQEEFVPFVRGDTGSCWCRFKIEHKWEKDGNKRTDLSGKEAPVIVTKISGRNCTIVQH